PCSSSQCCANALLNSAYNSRVGSYETLINLIAAVVPAFERVEALDPSEFDATDAAQPAKLRTTIASVTRLVIWRIFMTRFLLNAPGFMELRSAVKSNWNATGLEIANRP